MGHLPASVEACSAIRWVVSTGAQAGTSGAMTPEQPERTEAQAGSASLGILWFTLLPVQQCPIANQCTCAIAYCSTGCRQIVMSTHA